jgi:hypothetical protein
LKPFADFYCNHPVKITVGSAGASEKHAELFGAKAFSKDQVSESVEYLVKTNKELTALMRNVFDSFDADKSGSIDLKELEAISK